MAFFKDIKKQAVKNPEAQSEVKATPEIKEPKVENTITPLFELEETRYMLNLIANSEFKGRDIQTVYNIALKLQENLANNQ